MFQYFIFIISGFIVGNLLGICIERILKEEKVFKRPYINVSMNRIGIAIFTSILFLFIFKQNTPFIAIKYTTLICLVIVIGIIDFRTTDVYFKTTLPGFVLAISFIMYGSIIGINPKEYIISGVISGTIVGLIRLIGGGIGGGDIELLIICGLFLGTKLTVLVVLMSFTLAAIIGIVLIIFKKKSFKDYIPFTPFIAISTIYVLLI